MVEPLAAVTLMGPVVCVNIFMFVKVLLLSECFATKSALELSYSKMERFDVSSEGKLVAIPLSTAWLLTHDLLVANLFDYFEDRLGFVHILWLFFHLK